MRLHRFLLAVPLLAATVLISTITAGADRGGQAPTTPTATPVKHLVVIFQENVSFDHYFATYPKAANLAGESRFNAKSGTPSVNGLTDELLTDNPNASNPQRLSPAQALTCDQDHEYADEQASFNHGLMDKFIETVGTATGNDPKGQPCQARQVMDYYDGNTVTALWNYAQRFAMSDNSYGTTFGPSTPGAVNLVSGQTHGVGATATPGTSSLNGEVANGTIIGDPQPLGDICSTRDQARLTGRNIGDLLNDKGVTWGFFEGGFRSCSAKHPVGAAVGGTGQYGTKADYIPHHEPFQYYTSTANLQHLPPSSVGAIGSTDQANHQYDLPDFWAAVDNGNMPAVSYLKAAGYQDGHAGYSDPIDEQVFLVNTLNRLQQTKEWKDTAVVIAYDDSDGFYDHQMSPIVNQSQSADDRLTDPGQCGNNPARVSGGYEGRCGYGPRLPLLVVSPWARQNFVDHAITASPPSSGSWRTTGARAALATRPSTPRPGRWPTCSTSGGTAGPTASSSTRPPASLPARTPAGGTEYRGRVANASAVERELKFEAGSEFALPDLTALVPGGEVRALPPRRLEATYYDTADLRLARWGVTLRHRTGDDQPLWTVKLAAEDDKPDLRARHEISQPGSGDGPVPDDLAALVQAYARHEPLVQVARLVTRRVRFALHGPDGAPVAEVDDDEVVAYQRRKVVARFREIEAELDEAAVANGLARNVSRTFRKAGATPSLQGNKLLRALTGDLAADALAPELSVDGLGRHATVGELVRSAMANGARRLLVHDPLVRLDADIEAVHQARVATRRMRSDLKTFKQFVAPAWADPLGEELKWLGAVLGAVRDADVLGERMRDHVEALPEEDRKPAGRVLATLAAEREAAFAALQEAMASERYVDLLDTVVQAGQAPVLTDAAASQDGAEALRGVVGKRWKRLRADAKAAGDADEALHGVRIAAKRTRYAAEAGRAVLGKPGNALASASADVQSVLGDLHDAVVAEGWLRSVARSRLASATAVAVGLLIAREQHAAAEARAAWPEKWADAKQAWHDFNRSA